MISNDSSDALDVLAEASGVLTSSFDLGETLPRFVALCAGTLADYCALATHSASPWGFVESRPFAGSAGAEGLADRLRLNGFDRVVETPVNGRHEPLGTLFIATQTRGRFNGITGKLASMLALQVASAVEQAALFRRTYRVADRLQRALLPTTFPEIPGVSIQAAYRPASDEAEVGGDWYDAFELPDGTFAISMGDVAGHGLEAATIMGEARQAMRACAVVDASPSGVLQRVNRIVNLREGIGMVTALFGIYDPQRRLFTFSAAGHPAPVLAIEGRFTAFLPGGGLPLGVEPSIGARDWRFTIPPQSRLVCYTDGLTEYSRDIASGERELLAACEDAAIMDAPNPAAALQERIFGEIPNRDDAAAIVLNCTAGPVPRRWTFTAVPMVAPIARVLVHRFCDEHGLSAEQRFALTTALGEAIANAVEHAYHGQESGDLSIETSIGETEIVFEVVDHGRWRPFSPREERGRGMTLMHETMDRVQLISSRDETRVRLLLRR